MSLRSLAENDLSFILEDDVGGFGWSISLTDPNDVTVDFVGFSNDIATAIDPDTGQIVSGRVASIALRISSILSAGLTLPTGIVDDYSKPWIVRFNDLNGSTYTFKISNTHPDRGLGVITCMLEGYK